MEFSTASVLFRDEFFPFDRDQGDLDMAISDFDLPRSVLENVEILIGHLRERLADGEVDDSDRAGGQS